MPVVGHPALERLLLQLGRQVGLGVPLLLLALRMRTMVCSCKQTIAVT
eukprot:SAG22_NODE_11343_length_489_cov_1.589744_2_plen_47_part_01